MRVSEAVRRIVEADPWLRECIVKSVVNYSELARKLAPLVQSMVGEKVSVDAIKMALIRYAEKLRGDSGGLMEGVYRVLARSALEVRTSIAVVTMRLDALGKVAKLISELAGSARFTALMHSVSSVTLIIDEEHLNYVLSVVSSDEVVSLLRDQVAVVIVSPPDVISTPGFVAYIAALLARSGVNITQIESCHTDTILIVGKDDARKAFDLLTEAIEAAKQWVGRTTS